MRTLPFLLGFGFGTFLSRLLKVFSFLSLLFGIVFLVFGFFVRSEIQNFQENWATKEKLLIMKEGNIIHVGIAGTLAEGKEPHVLTQNEKVTILKGLMEQNEVLIMRHYYMTVIFSPDAFSSLTGEIIYAGTSLPVGQARTILLSPHPRDILVSFLGERAKTLPLVPDEYLKGLLFGLLFEEGVKQDPFFFINQYRDGTILVFPETFLFTLFKKVPEGVYGTLKTHVAIER